MRTSSLKIIFQRALISAKKLHFVKPKVFKTTILILLISVIAQILFFPTKQPPTSQNTHTKQQYEPSYHLYSLYRCHMCTNQNCKCYFFLLLYTHIHVYLINKVLLNFFQDKVIFKYNIITL